MAKIAKRTAKSREGIDRNKLYDLSEAVGGLATLDALAALDADPATERVSIVHVFTDAAAMTAHVEGAEARSAAAAEVMTPLGWAIYGPAPAPAVQMLREAAVAAGVPLELAAEPLGGFTRFADG